MVKERLARFAAMANEPIFDRRGINLGRVSWFQLLKSTAVVGTCLWTMIFWTYRGTNFVQMVIDRFITVEQAQKVTAVNVAGMGKDVDTLGHHVFTLAAQEAATTTSLTEVGNKVDELAVQVGAIGHKLDGVIPSQHADIP